MRPYYVLLIALMGLTTYATRIGFMGLSARTELPRWLQRALKYVPASILATLVFPAVLAPKGRVDISLGNPYLGAAAITAVLIMTTKNQLLSIVLGIVSLVVLRRLM